MIIPPSPGSMPAFFEIDEIFRQFLVYCDKPTLAALARTSKLFTDQALDALWEDLDSFGNLLKLLGSDLVGWSAESYRFTCTTQPQHKPSVNHLIVPRDWKRFTPYAARVKRWLQEDLQYIDEAVVDHLAFGRLPGYILPRLTHMDVMATSVSGLHLQTLLIAPTLESVTIWNTQPFTSATRQMNTFFRTLADRALRLQQLIIHWGNGQSVPQAFIEGLADVFSVEDSQLHTVHLWSACCIDARILSLLAQLPNMTTLHLNLLRIQDTQALREIVPKSGAFTNLQNVVLAGALDEFYNVLRYIGDSTQMVNLGFSIREYPRAKSLHPLFTAVAVHFPNLQTLRFEAPKEELDVNDANAEFLLNPAHYFLDMSVLRPLLSLRGFKAVHIELGIPLHLNDSDLNVIGRSWPSVEVLNLCSDPYCDQARASHPELSIYGIFELASTCRSLRTLGLYVDYSAHLSEELVATCDLVSHSIVHLDVGRSWILHPELVAAILSGVLPHLKVFQWHGVDDPASWSEATGTAHSPGWRRVFDMLSVFRAVRANESRLRSPLDSSESNVMIVD